MVSTVSHCKYIVACKQHLPLLIRGIPGCESNKQVLAELNSVSSVLLRMAPMSERDPLHGAL